MAAQIEKLLAHLREEKAYNAVRRYNYCGQVSAAELFAEAKAMGEFQNPEFVIDKYNEFVYYNLARWFVGDPAMQCIDPKTGEVCRADLSKGVFLAGPTGTGKTTAVNIYCYLSRLHGFAYNFRGTDERLAFTKYNADTIAETFTVGGDITSVLATNVLLINELGAEPVDSMYMGNRIDPLRRILDRRGDMFGKITFVTSNHSLRDNDLTERYGDRVVSRLFGMCNYLELLGEDRRK